MSLDDKLLTKIEQIINSFGAELTANKVILQLLVAHMLVMYPDTAEETLEKLRVDVIDTLKRTPHLSNQNEDKRVAELQVQHGERFFRELAVSVSAMRNNLGQSGRH